MAVCAALFAHFVDKCRPACNKPHCNKPHHYHKQVQDEPAQLTTITEENSWKSSSSSMSTGPVPEYQGPPPQSSKSYKNHHELHSIVVQPKVIVETTQNADDTNTTKVTAEIKVEVSTPSQLNYKL